MSAALITALFECQKLLGAESLVVDLRRGLDEILKMSSSQEVPQVYEFTMVFVLDY